MSRSNRLWRQRKAQRKREAEHGARQAKEREQLAAGGIYSWLGGLPKMREWIGERMIRETSVLTYDGFEFFRTNKLRRLKKPRKERRIARRAARQNEKRRNAPGFADTLAKAFEEFRFPFDGI